MLLALFGFLRLSLADILDILLLATLIFIVFRWIRGSSAISIFIAIISLFIIRVLVSAFNMRLMTAIMDMVLDVGVLALIVIFQPEIR
ncbi:MAG: TIGR00159 family protein, partial [Candidatus Cryptobacteroides sp.]|nr:TIGR00159 family protein [Candidatus Cryptobacteroides sp.]